jgi:hypothetical protein
MKNILLFSVFLLLALYISGQSAVQNIPVKKAAKDYYKYPWAGGMNSCQFNEIDLNLDGIMDLLVFDRQGNRLMPFINNGTSNSVDYSYAPAYIESFPAFDHWIMLEDYDMDGKNDIFTYNHSNPGIIVYKNISQADLRFELVVYPYLTSFYGSGYVNILVTYADYPAITDLDNDGDLDILTFWALGSFVELHKNQSIEKYGTADSLDFERTEYCWGYFAENEESNVVYLDTCFGTKAVPTHQQWENHLRDRHTGSTFLVIDLDADQDKDLILGDVDYPDLIKLVNGGTPDSAYMISYDLDFPSNSLPIDLFSMPLARYLDINNDGIKDMIVSPFDPNPYVTQNHSSVWLYRNTGENQFPVFEFQTSRFLQGDMIDVGSGAFPVLVDYDQDGLTDLFIGNYGYYDSSFYDNWMILYSVYTSKIAYFHNTGTAINPEFEFITDDFAHVSDLGVTGAFPTFGDLDGDDDLDMLIGIDDGTILFYRNCSCISNPDDFQLEDTNYQGIDVGKFSTPFLVDLDQDDLPDLAIGERGGNLNYFHNDGSIQQPVFNFVTDSLGKVNVTDYNVSYDGYSTPWFFRNHQGELELLVGSEQGKIFYFKDIEGNLNGTFTESDSLFLLVSQAPFILPTGFRTSAAIQDLNNNGYMDLLFGNFSGGINYFPDINKPPVNAGIQDINFWDEQNIRIYPNPAHDFISVVLPAEIISGPVHICIYDPMGQKIWKDVFFNESPINIDISHFSNGVYFISIRPDIKEQITGKIIKW